MLLNATLLIHSVIDTLPRGRHAALKVTRLSLILWVWAAVVMHKTIYILP